MDHREKARNVIRTLESESFYCDCPDCQEQMLLRDAGLFYLDDFTSEAAERYKTMREQLRERRQEIAKLKKSIPERSQRGAEAVNIGFVLERLAPSMPTFSFDRNDCRSLFDPIDYIIFEGLSRGGTVERIIFADIKTGGARLANKQRQIKTLVAAKQVEWDTYKPEGTP